MSLLWGLELCNYSPVNLAMLMASSTQWIITAQAWQGKAQELTFPCSSQAELDLDMTTEEAGNLALC